jgi:broad specificity phosphatase PhoE
MRTVYFITHPDVVVDPSLPIERWPLSAVGQRRMERVHDHSWAGAVEHVFSSAERKAIDGAEIFCRPSGLQPSVIPGLGENDRSATGFLEHAEFFRVVEEFFAQPEMSVRGWERAADAQSRIVGAIAEAVRRVGGAAPIAVIAHGGVGCLLMCHTLDAVISREYEQPGPAEGAIPGSGGGCYFVLETDAEGTACRLVKSWERLDA